MRINLTEDERERLETMSRSRALEGRLVLLARIVLLAAAGLSNRSIGEELGIDDKTAMRWRNRFWRSRKTPPTGVCVACEAVMRRLRSGETLPGFTAATGRRAIDPRTAFLMEALEEALGDFADLRRIREAERIVFEASGNSMSFLIPVLFMGHHLGLHGDELALGAVGRVVGWIAHAMEQFHGHALIHPRANYVGRLPGLPDALSQKS